MRVLLDANIYISYLLNPKKSGTLQQIVAAAFNQEYTLLLPGALLDEFVNKIPQKPYLAERIHPDELETFVALLHSISETIPVIQAKPPAVTRDPKDDYLLAYAMVGAADCLVTGDEDLLVLKQVGSLTILNPSDFAQKLKK